MMYFNFRNIHKNYNERVPLEGEGLKVCHKYYIKYTHTHALSLSPPEQEGLSSDSHISRSWDGHISLDDSMTSPDLISNLDRIPRQVYTHVYSHLSLILSIIVLNN